MIGNTDIPKPLVDIKECLPSNITAAQNGIIPTKQLKKIHCGGYLYPDAARSWLAMVKAAAEDGVFLNLNNPSNAYKNIIQQRRLFCERFVEIDISTPPPSDTVCVEFEGKTWALRDGKMFVERPGENSHGFGLAAFISNENDAAVRNWLNQNAESFGFVREYKFKSGRFIYVKARENVPSRVLEIEKSLPDREFSAALIAEYSGCKWYKTPPDDWSCNGMFYSEPFRTGALAVIDQGSNVGISEQSLKKIFRQCAGLICTDLTESLIKLNRPILITTDLEDTIEKLVALFNATSNTLSVSQEPDESLSIETNFYRKTNPEAVILQRKIALAHRLLKISVDDLRTAVTQPWYGEYHALLAIRLENPVLCKFGRKCCDELTVWYNERKKNDERELAVLGMIQFVDPMEITVPFNEHLWHKDMIADVRGVFQKHYTRNYYADEDISTYWLSRQSTWRHGKRKMRVVFIFNSFAKNDKLLPIYDIMREREDTEAFIVLHPNHEYKYGALYSNYVRNRYPDDKIYDLNSLIDLRRLRPDYVMVPNNYGDRRAFPSLGDNDVIMFAKLLQMTYGASMAHTFVDRLLDDYAQFFRNVYMLFSSAESVKKKVSARLSANVEFGYQHIEFLGYPTLDQAPLPVDEHSTKRILWTPRWSYDARIGGSHFMEYKDFFLDLRSKYGDKVELAMRPHMNLFGYVQKNGLMSKEEVADYKSRMKKNAVDLHDTVLDLEEDFRSTDILLTDYSTIVIVYFLTGRPIIYCDFPNAVFFDEYKEMYESMYIARNWDEVTHYLDELVAGNDPLFERRQKAIAKIRADHANAAQRIVDRIVEDFRQCEEPSLE